MALTGLTKVQKIGINSTTIPTFGGSRNTGVVTATTFVGDGSGLSNVTGSGAGVIVRDGGSLVGTAGTINFGTNLNVSAISAGIVTVTNAASATALTNLSDVTVTSASNGQILKHNGSVFVNTAETTYSQSSVASGSNVNLRLTDSGGTNDDILITAGSNITFSSVSANGFTIAASGGGGGGGLSNVVEDTTPQLGGSLDLNNKFITGSGGINVSGVVTATSFVGNLTGNVSGTASTASNAANVTVIDNSSANETVYPVFVDGTTGSQTVESDSGLTYNPSSGNLTATKFTGSGVALTGVVTSIVAGSNITLTGGPTGIVTIAAAGGGSGITDVIQDTTPQLGGNLDLNSKNITGTGSFNVTGVITATSFVGNITGNVTGNTSGSSGSCTGNAATATALQNARTIGGVSFDGTGNINLPGVNTTGNQDTTGNAGTATTATNVTLGNDSSGSTARRLVFASADTGNVSIQADTSDGATYTPSNGRISAGSFATISGTSSQFLKADGSVDSNTYLTSGSYLENVVEDTTPQLGGNLDLNSKNITGTGNAQIVGVITATSAVKTWTLGASGSSHYTFTGDGFTSATNDPDIYLERGHRYAFLNNSGGSHPFQIRVSNGGSAYSTGVTNNGASSGYITFNVPWDAPATLYYQCTNHSSMGGNIYIRGGAGANNNVGVTTISGGLLHINSGAAANGDAKLIIEADTDNADESANPFIEFKQDGSLPISAIGHGLLTGDQNGLTIANGVTNGFIRFATTGSSNNHANAAVRLGITPTGAVNIGLNPAQATGTHTQNAILNVKGYPNGETSAAILALIRGNNTTSTAAGHTLGRIVFSDKQAGEYAMIEGESEHTGAVGDTPGRLIFATANDGATTPTEKMRIDMDGNVKINTGNLVMGTSGKGIDFSISAGPTNGTTTQDSELFDDYEEGKITFESDNSGLSIDTSFKGRYTKIGELVTVSGYIVVSSLTSSSTAIRIKMPFTSAANSEGYYTRGVGATFSRYMNFPSNYHNMIAYVGGGENYMRFFMTRNTGASSDWWQMQHSNLSSTSAIYFNVCYTTTS